MEFKGLKSFKRHIYVKFLRAGQTKFKVLKDSKISDVSGFSYCALEPIHKARNDGNFRKRYFSGKLMIMVLFSWV